MARWRRGTETQGTRTAIGLCQCGFRAILGLLTLFGLMPPGATAQTVEMSRPVIAPTARSAAPVAMPFVTASDYRIAAGDELDISVWGEERMQRTVRVLPDGTFAFPLAGTIAANGQTVQQVSYLIRTRIANFYRAEIPDVTIGVRSSAATTFYVVGKVRTPGPYASIQSINIVQALSMAGGLAEFADVKHAVILRQTATGQRVEPVAVTKVLSGQRRLTAGALDQVLPVLGSGDVLVIP